MRSWIQLENKHDYELPPQLRAGDVRFSAELVRHFLREFTQPGDIVFDPFAGFGTTLYVAEQMDRIPYGIEFDAVRAEYIQQHITMPQGLTHGDALQLGSYDLPPINFSITSPPYTNRHDDENPFTSYSTTGSTYAGYLSNISDIYRQLVQKLAPDATAVIEIANLKDPRGDTLLAWDVAQAVSKVMQFQGEVVVGWDEYGYGYEHSYCLLFQPF